MSKSRRSTSGSLITVFSVNMASTSRTQTSVSHSSAEEAELYAMTQATVESLAIKHFIQEFKSAILSSDVKITVDRCFSREDYGITFGHIKEVKAH